MRVVVVGATGNVGTAVLRRLHEAAVDEIVGVARREPDASVYPYDGVRWERIDIGRAAAGARLREAFEGADAVIHLAWALQPNRDEPAMRATNVAGTERVLAAVAAASVPHVVVASSVGAYSFGPKTRRVDESWPTGGIATSHYSRYKAANERLLDAFEESHPGIRVSRVRPGLVFQPGAGAELARLFLGRFVPVGVLRRWRPPVLPFPSQGIFQAVHADDLADAFWRIVDRRASGAFNIAAEPVLDPQLIAATIGATRWVPVRARVARGVVELTWRLRLQATDPGWIDIGTQVPLMSTARARTELDWVPLVSSTDALAEVVDAIAAREGQPGSTPLQGRVRGSFPGRGHLVAGMWRIPAIPPQWVQGFEKEWRSRPIIGWACERSRKGHEMQWRPTSTAGPRARDPRQDAAELCKTPSCRRAYQRTAKPTMAAFASHEM